MKKKIGFKIFKIIITIIILLVLGFIIYYKYNKLINSEFSVKFLVDNELYKEEIVKYNGTLELETLNKTGFSFLGWFSGNTKYDNKTKIKNNLVLEARWEEFSNYVLFDDGFGNITKVPIEYNTKVNKIIDPTKAGYNFLGWYYNDEVFDFDKEITSNITLTAKWEKTNEIKGINVSEYIYNYINNSILFNTYFDGNNINVNIIGVNNKINSILDSIKSTTNTIINRDDIIRIEINYNGNLYIINNSNESSDVINRLFTDLTNTSNLEFNERNLSSLYNKSLNVTFIINSEYFYSTSNNNFVVNFTSDNIVTKEYMDNNSYRSVGLIKLYSVSFDKDTHNIYCSYKSSYADKTIASVVYDNSHIGGGSGTGLKDAMSVLASNQYLANLVIHLSDGSVSRISRGELASLSSSDVSLLSFGNKLLNSMGIGGNVTTVTHNRFSGRSAKLSVELIGGKAFEDGFLNDYSLIIG